MSEVTDRILTEKYRPSTFDDLILDKKEEILSYLNNEKIIPSFIFASTSPGTGKTSASKLIVNTLGCDHRIINSSDDRGIDFIRETVKTFATNKSSNGRKRCLVLDEADGLTPTAQDSLRNMIETYSDNCIFILTCNKLGKIIDPLQSRCVVINFDKPDKAEILIRLEDVCTKENIKYKSDNLQKIMEAYYPDIRSMIKYLNKCKILGQEPKIEEKSYEDFLNVLKKKDLKGLYAKTYDDNFDKDIFVDWLFKTLFETGNPDLQKYSQIMYHLADYEKSALLGVNREIVFVHSMMEIMKLL